MKLEFDNAVHMYTPADDDVNCEPLRLQYVKYTS